MLRAARRSRRVRRVDGAERSRDPRRVHREDEARPHALRAASAPRSCSPARCSRAAGRSTSPPPGGDVIGRRRIDTHVARASRRSAPTSRSTAAPSSRRPTASRGTEVFLDEPSVTGTENAVMAAVLAPGAPPDRNAACEPHVQDLCRMLVKMGARIEGIGSNMLHIDGRRAPARLRAPRRRRPHRGRLVHRPGRGHRRRRHDRGRRARAPARDSACLRPARRRTRVDGARPARARATRSWVVDDLGGQIPKIEDGAVAGVPGRPHVDRGRACHPGRGHGPDLREDVREPPVLRRQAGRDGRADRALRPAPGGGHRARASCTAQRRRARHPRRHGAADRRPVRRGHRA